MKEPLSMIVTDFLEQVWAVVHRFKFSSDALDILFIALVIYGVLRLVRETRSAQLLKGVFWLVLASIAVRVLKMQASSKILSLDFKEIFVLLVVLFQPEIRTMFESVGRSKVMSILALQPKHHADAEHQEILRAIQCIGALFRSFGEEHTGALVVFERQTMLGEIIKTGTIVNARVSRELVGNLFFPNSPLHDGALIIRAGRVEAAGCILPLASDQETIDSALGTRHRAAIGMSEQSDAMIAVVSEETGAISLAHRGKLQRGLTPEALEQLLWEGFQIPETVTGKFHFFKAKTKQKSKNAEKGDSRGRK